MTVSEQIIQVIDALCKRFGIAVDWTNENVVPYLQTLCDKLIAYEIVTSITWIVIMVLLSTASIIAAKKFAPILRERREEQDCYECGWTILTVFCAIGFVVVNLATFIVVSEQIMCIIKCFVFPEMHVFAYVNALM
jgi:hypothetical protein